MTTSSRSSAEQQAFSSGALDMDEPIGYGNISIGSTVRPDPPKTSWWAGTSREEFRQRFEEEAPRMNKQWSSFVSDGTSGGL